MRWNKLPEKLKRIEPNFNFKFIVYVAQETRNFENRPYHKHVEIAVLHVYLTTFIHAAVCFIYLFFSIYCLLLLSAVIVTIDEKMRYFIQFRKKILNNSIIQLSFSKWVHIMRVIQRSTRRMRNLNYCSQLEEWKSIWRIDCVVPWECCWW